VLIATPIWARTLEIRAKYPTHNRVTTPNLMIRNALHTYQVSVTSADMIELDSGRRIQTAKRKMLQQTIKELVPDDVYKQKKTQIKNSVLMMENLFLPTINYDEESMKTTTFKAEGQIKKEAMRQWLVDQHIIYDKSILFITQTKFNNKDIEKTLFSTMLETAIEANGYQVYGADDLKKKQVKTLDKNLFDQAQLIALAQRLNADKICVGEQTVSINIPTLKERFRLKLNELSDKITIRPSRIKIKQDIVLHDITVSYKFIVLDVKTNKIIKEINQSWTELTPLTAPEDYLQVNYAKLVEIRDMIAGELK